MHVYHVYMVFKIEHVEGKATMINLACEWLFGVQNLRVDLKKKERKKTPNIYMKHVKFMSVKIV